MSVSGDLRLIFLGIVTALELPSGLLDVSFRG